MKKCVALALSGLVMYISVLIMMHMRSSDKSKSKATGLKKDIVKQRTEELRDLFLSDYLDESLYVEALARFSEHLNNETTMNYTIRLASKLDLFNLAINRADLVGPRCSQKNFKRLIFYLYSFARELVLIGQEKVFKCRMESILNTIKDCSDSGVFKLTMYLVITSINIPAGGLCLVGSAPTLTTFVSKLPFGVLDWMLLSIYSIWAERMNVIAPNDQEAMCIFIGRLIENRAFWDEDIKTHFCWISKYLKCHQFDKINMKELISSPECVNFLKMSEQIIKQ